MNRFNAVLILVTLYTVSTDFIPLPPTALGKYNKADDPAGCFPPFSTIMMMMMMMMMMMAVQYNYVHLDADPTHSG